MDDPAYFPLCWAQVEVQAQGIQNSSHKLLEMKDG